MDDEQVLHCMDVGVAFCGQKMEGGRRKGDWSIGFGFLGIVLGGW